MAGGKGTRIASITNDEIPKPMLTVGGKTILEHQIECLKKSGVDEVIIVTGHLGEKIRDYFKDGSLLGIKISYYEEDPNKPLGTAGSLYYLKDNIEEDFILIFGDVFLSVDFNKMAEYHHKHSSDATLLTHPNSHPFDSDLVVVDDTGKVTGFDSKENNRDYDYKNLVNSGIYMFSPRVFDYVRKYKGNKVVILFLDDLHEAANGSENTAWQYDTDYEFLNDESIKQIIIAGARFLDGYVRLEIAGIDNNKIVHQRDELSAIDKIKLDDIDTIFILHDLYAMELKEAAKNKVEVLIKERNK